MSVNNISKILSYIYPISKQEIIYSNKIWEPVNSIYLRESLFCYDECLVCGRCCIYEDNIFLPFEVENMYDTLHYKTIDTSIHKLNGRAYSNIEELLESLEPINTIINGKSFKLFRCKLNPNEYTFNDRGTLKRCHWCLPTEDNRLGCGIHSVSSLTCKMPHIRFIYNEAKRSTSIGHYQYGRNWALKCPANISKSEMSLDTIDTVISNFTLLQQYCDYFEIDTYCFEILESLKQVKREQTFEDICNKNIVNGEVLF